MFGRISTASAAVVHVVNATEELNYCTIILYRRFKGAKEEALGTISCERREIVQKVVQLFAEKSSPEVLEQVDKSLQIETGLPDANTATQEIIFAAKPTSSGGETVQAYYRIFLNFTRLPENVL